MASLTVGMSQSYTATGNYSDGSTYDLTYDPASDRLRGTYYQAVAKQKFDVYFTRK